MSIETETQRALCQTHGSVLATRRIPTMGFPFIVFAIRRYLARRGPFRCPICETPTTSV